MPLAQPSDLELKTIHALLESLPQGSFSGLRVLEIGIGNGRLAWPFAADAALWVGLDCEAAELRAAATHPFKLTLPGLTLLASDACALGLAGQAFDVVFFSWSLCCLSPGAMRQALAEAERVLRPEGLLLDMHAADDPLFLEVWQAAYEGGNGQLARLPAIQRVPVGYLDPDGAPHGFAEATDALVAALETGGFTLNCSTAFEYRYFFDTLDELTAYLSDNHEHATASPALLQQAQAALKRASSRPKLVVIQRVTASALQKL